MRIFLLTLLALALTACSKPYDKYIGYWQLEDTKYPKILEIRKEDKDTYLVNENIFRDTDLLGKTKKETVLEKTEKEELGVNNGLTVIPFNLSDDGKTLRIRDQKYVKISEDIAKTAVKNRKDCNDLKIKYTEEKKPFDGFFFNGNPNQAKLDAVKVNIKNYSKKSLNAILVFKHLKMRDGSSAKPHSITPLWLVYFFNLLTCISSTCNCSVKALFVS